MERTTVTCIVIVAEAFVESRLLSDLAEIGVRGWTVTRAQGHGPEDRRVSEFEGGNVRIEILASEATVGGIWELLEEKYFADYSIAAWDFPVAVMRSARYTTS